jgi:hypothetical protein
VFAVCDEAALRNRFDVRVPDFDESMNRNNSEISGLITHHARALFQTSTVPAVLLTVNSTIFLVVIIGLIIRYVSLNIIRKYYYP